jgi:endonuclease G
MKKLIAILFIVCSSFGQPCNSIQDSCLKQSPHFILGKPHNKDNSDDLIICRDQYVLSYNPNLNVANWVAWRLSDSDFGKFVSKNKEYIPDPTLPKSLTKITTKDYKDSIYIKGHMVPNNERSASKKDNKTTFYLTNIVPQHKAVNSGVWASFERYIEKLCKEQKQLIIIAGIICTTKNKLNGKVTIPDSLYKIAVVLSPENQPIEVYAIIVSNDSTNAKDNWEKHKTSLEQIELSSGYQLFNDEFSNIINHLTKHEK